MSKSTTHTLVMDYLNEHGENCWREMTVILTPSVDMKEIVQAIIGVTARQGHKALCIVELLNGLSYADAEKFHSIADLMEVSRALYVNVEALA